MGVPNPKEYDRNAKLLILTFVQEFFEFFFPGVAVEQIQFLDKEFVGGNAELTESLKADLLLFLSAVASGKPRDIVVILEHKHQDVDCSAKLCRYLFHAYQDHETSIWPIIFYTGKGKGKNLPNRLSFTCGYEPSTQDLTDDFLRVGLVKMCDYKSKNLIGGDSIFKRLLALLADDVDTSREDMVRGIFKWVSKKWNKLGNNAKICIDRFVKSYSGLGEAALADTLSPWHFTRLGRGRRDSASNWPRFRFGSRRMTDLIALLAKF